MYIAFKIMKYKPLQEYGLYRFDYGDVQSQVEFKPMVKKEHAFILLDKLAEIGYDYSIECVSDDQVTEENVFNQQGYHIYMKHRDNPKQKAIESKGTSLFQCIMDVALQAARLVD